MINLNGYKLYLKLIEDKFLLWLIKFNKDAVGINNLEFNMISLNTDSRVFLLLVKSSVNLKSSRKISIKAIKKDSNEIEPHDFLIVKGITDCGRFSKFKYNPPVSCGIKTEIVDEVYSINLELWLAKLIHSLLLSIANSRKFKLSSKFKKYKFFADSTSLLL